ncbi:MAG: hypothetical protein M1827_003339 [Pycnora praestabilis]|nr:MAG: hypothetical protein M1827_003339 [Pycnora praestabilis]
MESLVRKPEFQIGQAPAVEAEKQWQTNLSILRLTAEDYEALHSIQSLPDFLEYTRSLNDKHRAKRNGKVRDRILRNIASFDNFAGSYSSVVDAVKGADPFGVGNAIWGLSSLVVTVIARKHRQERLIHDSLITVFKSLPRLDGYSKIYPTDRMIGLLAELHARVFIFLSKVFLYYRKCGWKGSLSVYYQNPPSSCDELRSILSDIDQLSQDIFHESSIGMSSELRTTRLLAEETKENLRRKTEKLSHDLGCLREELGEKSLEASHELGIIKKELEETSLQVTHLSDKAADMEVHKHEKALHRIRNHLVHSDYDPAAVFSAASRQIRHGSRQTTSQMRACRITIDNPLFTAWLHYAHDPTVANIPKKKIIWIKSSNHQDLTVSHIALGVMGLLESSFQELLDSLTATEQGIFPGSSINKGHPIVIHSMHQTELSYLAPSDTRSTASTLLKGAIYQLLTHNPTPILSIKALQQYTRSTPGTHRLSLEDLGSLMRELLDHLPNKFPISPESPSTAGTKDLPLLTSDTTDQRRLPVQPVYWIIDRIDTIAFRNCPGSSKLYDFAKVLEKLVGGPNGRLRVLVTSLYSPQRIDGRWDDGVEDDEEGALREWVECGYGER